ncbi:MAG: 3-phosphoshikimate 1-carboxyvinyltransferase, partial [Candidatus Omnitrophica bacterium]|nr:3-phosphoshikimate 1-carboxyvinyltransferase [Candidatus Omnitrophota bacterium]
MNSFPNKYILTPKPVPDRVEVSWPGSKSYTNRALLLAALADGRSVLTNALDSDDTNRMVEALNDLGIPTRFDKVSHTIEVEGKGGPQRVPEQPIDCGNAGTAIRFLTPFCCAAPGKVVLTGNTRMRERPIRDLIEGLRQIGGTVHDTKGTGCPPLEIEGGGIKGGVCRLEGSRSSQYFSALLMNAPLMEQGVTLEVEGDLVSKPYIDMTLDIMARFGIEATNENYQRLVVPPGQQVKPTEYEVEGDASGASYFLAAAAVSG